MTDSIQDLADAIGAAVGDIGDDQRAIWLALYDLLADGEPVTIAMLASRAELDAAAVEPILDGMLGIFRDDEGRVVGFAGLAIPKMDHHFHADGGKPIHAWCALDPFLIVPLIGRAAKVASHDPMTGESVTMTVTPDGIKDLAPESAVVSLLAPDGPFGQDVIQTFCNYVHNFARLESAQHWAVGRQGITLMSTAEAFEVGQRAWRVLRGPAAAD